MFFFFVRLTTRITIVTGYRGSTRSNESIEVALRLNHQTVTNNFLWVNFLFGHYLGLLPGFNCCLDRKDPFLSLQENYFFIGLLSLNLIAEVEYMDDD